MVTADGRRSRLLALMVGPTGLSTRAAHRGVDGGPVRRGRSLAGGAKVLAPPADRNDAGFHQVEAVEELGELLPGASGYVGLAFRGQVFERGGDGRRH